MPKTLQAKSIVQKPDASDNWVSRKKNLPKNWCQIVSKAICSNGLKITAAQVKDIRRGKIKNPAAQFRVWKEIKKLERLELRRQEKLAALKN